MHTDAELRKLPCINPLANLQCGKQGKRIEDPSRQRHLRITLRKMTAQVPLGLLEQ